MISHIQLDNSIKSQMSDDNINSNKLQISQSPEATQDDSSTSELETVANKNFNHIFNNQNYNDLTDIIKRAWEVRENAYCPYSGF